MLRIRPAFEGLDVVYVGVKTMYAADVAPARFYCVRDVSRLQLWALPFTVGKLLFILLWERPKVIVTTGSAPGMLALRLGRLLGTRTVWIDSIANVAEVSLSGRKAARYADLWLTQWKHLTSPEGPAYEGSVI